MEKRGRADEQDLPADRGVEPPAENRSLSRLPPTTKYQTTQAAETVAQGPSRRRRRACPNRAGHRPMKERQRQPFSKMKKGASTMFSNTPISSVTIATRGLPSARIAAFSPKPTIWHTAPAEDDPHILPRVRKHGSWRRRTAAADRARGKPTAVIASDGDREHRRRVPQHGFGFGPLLLAEADRDQRPAPKPINMLKRHQDQHEREGDGHRRDAVVAQRPAHEHAVDRVGRLRQHAHDRRQRELQQQFGDAPAPQPLGGERLSAAGGSAAGRASDIAWLNNCARFLPRRRRSPARAQFPPNFARNSSCRVESW